MTGTPCKICDRLLPLSSFKVRTLHRAGKPDTVYRINTCLGCFRRSHRSYNRSPERRAKDSKHKREVYQRDRELLIARSRQDRMLNPDKHADRSLRKLYGITLNERDEMLKAQGNMCAICQETHPTSGKRWPVDHNHSTGRVRGVLCFRCNTMIGYAREKVSVLKQAIEYLRKEMQQEQSLKCQAA